MVEKQLRLDPKLPQTENNPVKDAQFKFDGQWLPDYDAARIGPENFTDLQNLRYIDGGLEGILGYSKINTTALSTYTNIRNGFHLRSNRTQKTYTLAHAADSSGNGRVYENRTDIPDQGDFEGTQLHSDTSANLTGRFSHAPNDSMCYCNEEETLLYSGDEIRVSGFITVDNTSHDNPEDHTDKINNIQSGTGEFVDIGTNQDYVLVFSTRQLNGVKFYIKTANSNGGSTMTCKFWNGASWTAVSGASDGTSDGTDALAQDGVFEFNQTTTAEPYHFQGLYMYAYRFYLDAGNADVYHVSLQAPFQDLQDIWDGVYRQPIQFQYYNADHYDDYTLHVNESSDINTPIGAELNGLANATDSIIIMFEERMSAIKIVMLGGRINTNASVLTVKYWDGDEWGSVSATDGTDNGGDTFGQSGLISWTPDAPEDTDEKPQTLFGTTGYAYQLTFSADFSATDITVDLCTGIPAQQKTRPFKFSSLYKGRLMLGGYMQGKEGNRMDFSMKYGAEVFNGYDSSMDGLQSLYFGGMGDLTGTANLYNRFGSRVFSILLVFKQNETYILDGESPDDFMIYPVSNKVGCPAPLTLDTAEIGFELAENVQRNVAIWISHSGPIMFDGAVISPLKGIDTYFDPNSDDCINFDYITNARGWVDSTYREYNLLIPTGNETDPNVWLVYDLTRKRWYKKDTGTSNMPICGFPVFSEEGNQYIYGGLTTGYMMRLENGTDWDGANIQQRVETGDFWPTGNIWQQTLIRRLKIVTKKIVESATLEVLYYRDTDLEVGENVTFRDGDVVFTDGDVAWSSPTTITLDISLAGSTERLARDTEPLNKLGWSHRFAFILETNSTTNGFRPIYWGIQYVYARDDLGTES